MLFGVQAKRKYIAVKWEHEVIYMPKIRDQATQNIVAGIEDALKSYEQKGFELVNIIPLSKDGALRSGQGGTTDLLLCFKRPVLNQI